MGFVSPITLRDEGFVPMQLLNLIFGAGMTSKLFMNVREKLSLCYDISSGYHGSKGIVAVCAGIDSDKDALVRREVQKQVDACIAGDVTAEELVAAKEALLSSLRTTHDSPGAIEGYYATAAISGLALDPDGYMQAVEAVTAADVARVAQTLQLHTVYFLKGVK
jgi:predicted Zn-dependent peptidase